MSDEATGLPVEVGGRGVGALFTNPNNVESDCNMLRRAVRERWPIPEEDRAAFAEIAKRIALTGTTTMYLRDGTPVEMPNSKAQLKALDILVKMVGQNQADEHLADKNRRMDEGRPTEVVRELRVAFDE